MGQLINGKWTKDSIVTSDDKGAFKRLVRTFREHISQDHPTFKPESGRYHLYVSYACPWAHRTLIYRELKGLQDHITVNVVHPHLLEHGWVLNKPFPGATEDTVNGKKYLYELYQQAQSDITTSSTVPILWDKKEGTVVNNESSEIIRMFNTAFNDITGNTLNFYPEHLQKEIDDWNERIYEPINNGVYKSGFAKSQEAYEKAVTRLFEGLDEIDAHLKNNDYLVRGQLTEADLRLVPTLLRFDPVYVVHFKTSLKRIKDYENISRYLDRIYSLEAIKKTTNLEHIKEHYFYSHDWINPYRIIPIGPESLF